MTTSSTYAITVTAQSMVNAISRIVFNTSKPDAAETKDIIEAINFWMLQIQEPTSTFNPSELIWQRETVDLTLSSKISYDLKPSGGDADIQIPLEIITANIKDTDSNEYTLDPMDVFEFQAIADKTATGSPSKYLYERRLDTGKFSLDIIPADTTDVVDIIYRQPLELITAGNETFDIIPYFYRFMKYDVALDMAPESRMDGETYAQVMARRNEAKAFVDSANPENSTDFFQPELD